MNLLESKVIQTELEKEIFIDQGSNIKIMNFQYPKKNFPYYDVFVSIEMIRIRGNEYYGTKNEIFGIRMTKDLQSIYIFEPEKQNIFAIKNEQERQATVELISYLLTESANFKQLVTTMIDQLKHANLICESQIREAKDKLELLERLLNLSPQEINYPSYKRITA